ncbi:hypothetical protein [Flavobacterium sp.]|uniref:hypothetical protein n=1 Tax=Flavobacterium sp. TaxID=239 RepID=UPI0039E33462
MKTTLHLWIWAALVLCGSESAMGQQHVWRVNKNTAYNQWTNHQVFTELQQAINSNVVQTGDTIYVEATAPSEYYLPATITNKKLTIIGTGYFLTQNLGLQHNSNTSRVASITFGPGSSGSSVYGIETTGGAGSGIHFSNNALSDITVARCTGFIEFNNSVSVPLNNIRIQQNHVTINFGASNISQLLVTNNYLKVLEIGELAEGNVAQNVIFTNVNIRGIQFFNNIVLGDIIHQNTNSAANVYNNIFDFAQPAWLVGGNNNFGLPSEYIFSTALTSTDGRFQVRPANQCPECYQGFPFPTGTGVQIGMFGGNNPQVEAYRLSGIPSIPSITNLYGPALAVPSETIPVTISTRTNN